MKFPCALIKNVVRPLNKSREIKRLQLVEIEAEFNLSHL